MMPTPEGHENGKEDRGWVVEEVAGSGSATRCAQLPKFTGSVTKRAHSEVPFFITHLQTGKTNQTMDISVQMHLLEFYTVSSIVT